MSAADLVFARLKREEGERLLAYDDATGLRVRAPKGKLTWGRGFNLDACGSTALFDVIERFLIAENEKALQALDWYRALDPVRQSVFLDVAYNAGVHGLLGFPHAIAYAEQKNWVMSSQELRVGDPALDKSRYASLRQILITGVI